MLDVSTARYLRVRAEVRYWEDARLNGVEDTEGKIPMRSGECWLPIIDLRTGAVLEWPVGITAKVHYKVCDAGEYWLLNEKRQRIAKWKGYYVPDALLCIDSAGHGDYIILTIGADGFIVNWRFNGLDPDQWNPV